MGKKKGRKVQKKDEKSAELPDPSKQEQGQNLSTPQGVPHVAKEAPSTSQQASSRQQEAPRAPRGPKASSTQQETPRAPWGPKSPPTVPQASSTQQAPRAPWGPKSPPTVPQASSTQQEASRAPWGPKSPPTVPQASSTQQEAPRAPWGPKSPPTVPQASWTQQEAPRAPWGPKSAPTVPQASSTQQEAPRARWGPKSPPTVPQASSTQQEAPRAPWGPKSPPTVPQASSTQQEAPRAPWGPKSPPTVPQASSTSSEAPTVLCAETPNGKGRGRGRGRDQNQNQNKVKKICSQPGESKQLPLQEQSNLPQFSLTQSSTETVYQSPSTSQKGPVTPVKKPEKIQNTLKIPVRKDPNICGTKGKRITVEVNVMSFNFNKLRTNVSQYDISIDPDKPRSQMRRVFEKFRVQYFSSRNPAYDGNKIIYSAGDLPFKECLSGEVEIEDNGRKRTFSVEIKKTNEINLSFLKNVCPGFNDSFGTQSGIQALDVILRHGPLTYNFPVGRSIFWQPRNRIQNLSGGMELWTGQFQSAILGWKPLLNVDVAHKGFPIPQNVIDVINEFCFYGNNTGQRVNFSDIERNIERINKFLIGLKVHYEIPKVLASKRTHIVRGLIKQTPRTCKFERSENVFCTVEEYFQQEKKYRIQFPDWPCLWIGAPNKKIYVPPELCVIVPGQVRKKKMTEKQTSNIIKYAATNTDIRKQKIMNGFNALRMNEYPTMRNEFNLSINPVFERVPARVLQPPELNYKNDDRVQVRRGIWKAKKMLNPATLKANEWAIMNLNPNVPWNKIEDLIKGLSQASLEYGITLERTSIIKECKPDRILEYLTTFKENKIKLVLVIIPDYADIYCKVKQIAELRTNILTQCVKSITVIQKNSPPTWGNILLKINSKLNGINHIISQRARPKVLNGTTILIGADVTHPSPDSENIPSIAAVTASCDLMGFKYAIELRLQPPRQEIISDLAEIVRDLFLVFKNETKQEPKKVIVYRDGVSDGQLEQVMEQELKAFDNAFKLLQCKQKPEVTFLVVQKRHHIRFFPTDPSLSDDKNKNVQAGTIVDTHITHPNHIDFYLVSHASIQGTARPTKYKCVSNEINMTEDEIEELTYYLCHMFARCTRAVSYPAPTYYAHLAAFRARALIQNNPIDLENLKNEQYKIQIPLKSSSPMFFV